MTAPLSFGPRPVGARASTGGPRRLGRGPPAATRSRRPGSARRASDRSCVNDAHAATAIREAIGPRDDVAARRVGR